MFRILRDFTWDIRFFQHKLNSESPYDFSNFQKYSKKHQKLSLAKQAFLEWFLGFAEGHGSFGIRDGRLTFTIDQAEIEILQKIRSELGFGTVLTFHQNERVYARYSVSDKQGIFCLIHLFNGNIQLQKVQTRFELWVHTFNSTKTYSTYEKICISPRRLVTDISFETAWLAGFFDAEGGFSASLTESQEDPKRYARLRLKAYLDQKDEWDVLQHIAELFEVKSVFVRNAEKQTYRVDCSTQKSLANILLYFSKHKLRSKKHVVYAMWKKITYAYVNDSAIENIPQLKRRISRIQSQNNLFKQLKTGLPK